MQEKQEKAAKSRGKARSSGSAPIQRGKLKVSKARFQSFADLDLRTVAARRAQEVVNRLQEDLGGASNVSTAERQLVQHAGVLSAFIEDQEVRFISGHKIETNELLAAINVQRRLLVTLGLQRRQRDVTPALQDYLRFKEQEKQNEVEHESEEDDDE
ncbi:hypothetical protein GGQ85_000237 [Nitrobacter vulgaris]|uniref:hypothetical protein n=1 Tax=Nitrobacter vulgaris TaxID=29421 RepID=UPI0028563BA6|nr:hypothetical protein [Nitrobacter vulgaris]MDR6302561.1 hypothetical protein [Nitrobacter vulgaris]